MSSYGSAAPERQDLETYSDLPHSDLVIFLARVVATLVAIAAIIVISLIIVFARFILVLLVEKFGMTALVLAAAAVVVASNYHGSIPNVSFVRILLRSCF